MWVTIFGKSILVFYLYLFVLIGCGVVVKIDGEVFIL